VLEEATRSAARDADVSFVVLTSAAARRRLLAALAAGQADPLGAAQALIVPCVAGNAAAAAIRAGASIGSLLVALRARDLASWWDPDRPLEVDRVRAALAADERTTPFGVVGVSPAAESGA
jgi:hypothetical protein